MQHKKKQFAIFGFQLSRTKRSDSTTVKFESEDRQSPDPQSSPPDKTRQGLSRRFFYWIAGMGLLGLIFFALRPKPIAVDLGLVERGDLWVTVDADGKTRVRDRFTIAAPVSGRLTRIELEPGDSIQSGTVVAQIDPLPFNTQVKETQARLRELRAQLAGVATQRTKPAALAQAEAQIDAAIAKQRRAEAQMKEAQANLAQATRDRQRAQNLAAEGAQSRKVREDAELTETRRQQELKATQRLVESATSEVAAARSFLSVLQGEQQDPDYLEEVYRAQIASTEASLKNLTDEARRTTIFAPVAGSVLRVRQKSSRFVQAGDPLLEVGNKEQLELVIDILSPDAVKVKPGTLIQIEYWGGDEPLQARVRYVEPSAFTEVSALGVEEQRVNVIADFIDLPQSLGDGYRVEARIVTWEGKNVLKVPLSALFRCGGRRRIPQSDRLWCTFVAKNGKAQKREIVISERSDLEAAIDRGLEAGERVILYPTEQIESGKSIRNGSVTDSKK